MSRQRSESTLRFELAEAAARLIAVDGVADYLSAKKKAAQRLGVTEKKHLPSNREIETALIQYQRLFQSGSQPDILKHKRELALEAMEFLKGFRTYLVGSVLKGTASEHSTIHLILYTDSPEDIDCHLLDHGIPYELMDRSVKFKPNEEISFPCYQFIVRESPIAITVFPAKRINQSPLSPTDGNPLDRVGISQVKMLLDETGTPAK